MDDGVGFGNFSETVRSVNERDPGQEGSLPVFFRIADIDAFGIPVAGHDQFDVLTFGKAGAFPFLIVDEQIRSAGGGKESFDS